MYLHTFIRSEIDPFGDRFTKIGADLTYACGCSHGRYTKARARRPYLTETRLNAFK
jgi:hypothetical protein